MILLLKGNAAEIDTSVKKNETAAKKNTKPRMDANHRAPILETQSLLLDSGTHKKTSNFETKQQR